LTKLHKFIQAKKLGHTDLASEMIKVLDETDVDFDAICEEVEKLFVDPDAVMALISGL
jgi:hypothetical protein